MHFPWFIHKILYSRHQAKWPTSMHKIDKEYSIFFINFNMADAYLWKKKEIWAYQMLE